jgi:hypothetical protein
MIDGEVNQFGQPTTKTPVFLIWQGFYEYPTNIHRIFTQNTDIRSLRNEFPIHITVLYIV